MPGALNEIEEKALNEFRTILSKTFGDKVKMLILYGSKARGDYSRESDIDVFVLLDKSDFKVRDQIVDIAYDLFLKYEVLLSPRVINMDEYELLNRWQTTFIKNLQRDGIKI